MKVKFDDEINNNKMEFEIDNEIENINGNNIFIDWFKNLFGIRKEIIVKNITICSGSKEIFDSEKYLNKKLKNEDSE